MTSKIFKHKSKNFIKINKAISQKRILEQKQTISRRTDLLKERQKPGGLFKLNIIRFAAKWNCSIQTIYEDIRASNASFVLKDLETYEVELSQGYEEMIAAARANMNNPELEPHIQAMWGKLLLDAQKDITNFLESYGRKQQLRFDNLEQEVQINQVQIIQNVVKEMEEKRIEKDAN